MEQISQLFVIKLNVWAHDEIVFGIICLCSTKNWLKTTRYETFFWWIFRISHHSIGFTWASLPISKNCSIISFKDIFSKFTTCTLEHLILFSLLWEYSIKCKNFIIISLTINILESNLPFSKIRSETLWSGYISIILHLADYFWMIGLILMKTLIHSSDIEKTNF